MFSKFWDGNFKLLKNAISEGEDVSVFGLNLGEKLALLDDSAFLFFVVENEDSVLKVCEKFEELGRTCDYIISPITPLDNEFESSQKLLSILNKINDESINTLVITPEVMAGMLPKKELVKNYKLTVGQDINITKLCETLTLMNYKRVDMVSEPCQFAIRGDIIDIYPQNFEPVRIFVDFDKIESIKQFNSITMLTSCNLDSISISSNSFIFASKKKIDDFYETNKLKYDEIYEELIALKDNDYRLIALARENYCSIFDYVTNGTIAFDGAKAIYDKLHSFVDDYNEKIKNQKFPLDILLKSSKIDIKDCLKFTNQNLIAFHYITNANRLFSPKKVFSIRTLSPINYVNYMDSLGLDLSNFNKQNYTVILCVGNEENIYKFSEILDKFNIIYEKKNSISLCNKHSINLLTKKYPLDILLPDEKLVVISTDSLLGVKKKVKNIKVDFFDGELPQKDDFVVHNTHGIGKCLGVQTLKLTNSLRDYVVIEYKNSDKLYLPVENMDQISKYLGSDKAPDLNKIGGVEFAKTKAKVKSVVKKIAFDLVSLYRERMKTKGFKYASDDELMLKFENSFEFNETSDQLKAISDCKNDMEAGKIMDRLICGDVGFGKTEVALRIAFKTIVAGKQVAFLCPTTILSEQHLNTAKKRMSEFGVKIEVLNRLRTPAEVSKIKKDLKDGKIDLIIGTHKLLANDIEYKNLGLLILDEEQKFGVSDKDKIKNIKKNINVLTLSATPIPRTLNLSLIGVRDISVIETPPVERITSDVQVVEYSNDLLKRAIDMELSRNGQVLIIYNRVESIYKFASFVSSIVPNAIISVAHGQMTSLELEQEIYKLYSGKTQVLVATTLIENGVDLPNANTLIVINSDLLGLSQLYQLKGRIGRSDKNSFAYFTYDDKKLLTENAYKRLQAIKEFSGMGSGFKIAMKDLEIRGAGNLLGAEQSGHIGKIGYNMYVRLLSDSIKEINNQKIDVLSDVRVETTISAYLSHDYISSSTARMKIYRDISSIDSIEKYVDFVKNTESIFGDIPQELINLAKIGFIKNMCAKLGASRVIIKEKISIVLPDKQFITKELIDLTMKEYLNNVNFNFSSTPTIEIIGVEKKEMLDFLISYLQFVECL